MPLPGSIPARLAQIHRLAQPLGFALLGTAPAVPAPHADFLRQWIAAGKQGQMDYLVDQLQERLDPQRLQPGARTVICLADRHPYTPPAADRFSPAPPVGRIARYAWHPDYHTSLKKRIRKLADALREVWPEHAFRTCVDTAPLLEREYAQLAGLGWIGKNTMLIHPALGSWFLLGEILTTLPLATAADLGQTITDHCGSCTRCLDACPTQCLTPYQIDASRCLGYLNIEHKDTIAPAYHAPLADWLAGCDICQEVCPFNQRLPEFPPPAALPRPPRSAPASPAPSPQGYELLLDEPIAPVHPPTQLSLHDVLAWDESARRLMLFRSALKRIKLEQFKRNAIILAGNHLKKHDDPELREQIQRLAQNPAEPDLLRQTARDVLLSLSN